MLLEDPTFFTSPDGVNRATWGTNGAFSQNSSGIYVSDDAQQAPTPEPTSSSQSTKRKRREPTQNAGDLLTKDQKEVIEQGKTDIVELLRGGQIKGWEDFKSWHPSFQNKILETIVKKGTKYAENPFLSYISAISKSPVIKTGVDLKTLEVIEGALEDGLLPNDKQVLQKTKKYNYLMDADAYKADDQEYKLKALIFLSSDKAKSYGEISKAPVEEILRSEKKSEIQGLLTKWQTKRGDESDASTTRSVGSRSKKTSERVSGAQAQKNFTQKYGDKGSIALSIRKIADSLRQTGIPAGSSEAAAVGQYILSQLPRVDGKDSENNNA